MILQYKRFLSVLDDILWVSLFIPTVTISPNFCSYGVAGFFFNFSKVFILLRLNVMRRWARRVLPFSLELELPQHEPYGLHIRVPESHSNIVDFTMKLSDIIKSNIRRSDIKISSVWVDHMKL